MGNSFITAADLRQFSTPTDSTTAEKYITQVDYTPTDSTPAEKYITQVDYTPTDSTRETDLLHTEPAKCAFSVSDVDDDLDSDVDDDLDSNLDTESDSSEDVNARYPDNDLDIYSDSDSCIDSDVDDNINFGVDFSVDSSKFSLESCKDKEYIINTQDKLNMSNTLNTPDIGSEPSFVSTLIACIKLNDLEKVKDIWVRRVTNTREPFMHYAKVEEALEYALDGQYTDVFEWLMVNTKVRLTFRMLPWINWNRFIHIAPAMYSKVEAYFNEVRSRYTYRCDNFMKDNEKQELQEIYKYCVRYGFNLLLNEVITYAVYRKYTLSLFYTDKIERVSPFNCEVVHTLLTRTNLFTRRCLQPDQLATYEAYLNTLCLAEQSEQSDQVNAPEADQADTLNNTVNQKDTEDTLNNTAEQADTANKNDQVNAPNQTESLNRDPYPELIAELAKYKKQFESIHNILDVYGDEIEQEVMEQLMAIFE